MAVDRGTPAQQANGPRRQWLRRVVMVLGGLLLVAIVAWLSSPRVRVVSDYTDVADLSLAGIGTHVKSAAFVSSVGGVIPLTVRADGLISSTHLKAGVSGYLTLTLTGPAGLQWLPWETRVLNISLRTPVRPAVQTKVVHSAIGAHLTVTFNEPVHAVRYRLAGEADHTLVLRSWQRSVVLPLTPAKPGQKRAVLVAGRARSWETWGTAYTVRWSSVPYVTATQTQTNVEPTGTLIVQFSVPLKTAHLANWVLAPQEKGTWHAVTATEYEFTPMGSMGYGPGALVQLTIPSGVKGPVAVSGSVLQSPAVLQWRTPDGSVLRLQQLLALEGYLPVSWTASTPATQDTLSYEESTIYNPPAGHFTWKYPNLPSVLDTLWSPGQMTVVTQGAIMQFEAENGLTPDGVAGPQVWSTLIADYVAGKNDPAPYTYIFVTENLPETLELWSDNSLVLTTDANTGISVTPTYLGTFPIYERLPFQIMRGTNPDGVPYADPVHWIDYFKGGDAVHGFVRASYGFPQSLGCVEVPLPVAPTIYQTVNYGTLVTVNPVGIPPAPVPAPHASS